MKQLHVDVVVNNYNYAQYLRDSIDSALRQTYARVSVIVVDDGSTDDSAMVIESYGSAIDAVLKDNGGQASAFNAGLARSSGDIVIFLDADDVLLPDVAERIVEVFARDPSAVKVHYPMEVIDSAGRPTGVRLPQQHLTLPSGDLRQHILAFPFDVVWMATSGNGFAVQPLRRIFPIPEADFRILADWYLNHVIGLFGPIRTLAEVGAYRRMHGANIHAATEGSLDIEYLRRTILCATHVRAHLSRIARREGLLCPQEDRILSVSDIVHRLISVRIDPVHHPTSGDTVFGLLADGMRATNRRFDVRWPMKVLFLLSFVVLSIAPRRASLFFAEHFLLTERRGRVNRLLGALHR
jgi:glycosyltransferase involved in cell wall biosynthesis